MNSTWLITSELANQRARKALFTCVVYTNIVYGDDSRLVKGSGDFIDDVGLEKVKVQLTLSARVEGESAYLTLRFSLLGSVPVILWAGGGKLDDVVSGF